MGGGFVLEFGQIFLPARTAEVTSVLMAAAGAGPGSRALEMGRVTASIDHGGYALSHRPARRTQGVIADRFIAITLAVRAGRRME